MKGAGLSVWECVMGFREKMGGAVAGTGDEV